MATPHMTTSRMSQSKRLLQAAGSDSALSTTILIYATAASLIFPQIFFPSKIPRRHRRVTPTLRRRLCGSDPLEPFLGHWGDTHGRKTC